MITRANESILITGGARSGKSRYAEALAKSFGGEDVTFIATLAASDEEMKRRIERHRQRRPPGWRTMESPHDLPQALRQATTTVVLIDCLSGWVSNLVLEHEHQAEEHVSNVVFEAITALIDAVTETRSTIVVVTNEVGSGVVPSYPLGRWYRDALGLANQRVAKAADTAVLFTMGLPQLLKGSLPDVSLEP